MAERQVTPPNKALVVVLVALAAAAAAVLAARTFVSRKARPVVAAPFQADWQSVGRVDPALIRFAERASFPAGVESPACLAVGGDDNIHVGGEGRIAVFGAAGSRLAEMPAPSPLLAMTVAPDGRIFVSAGDHVEIIPPAGGDATRWAAPYEDAVMTAVAVRGEDVFVAEYAQRCVLHYDLSGKLLGKLAPPASEEDEDPDGPQSPLGTPFQVPSPHFDLAFAPDGMLRVVNPGLFRVEAWTIDGFREFAWGTGSNEIDGFLGCCNPAHIAVMRDGRIVTSEKGVARVKIYKADRGFGRNGLLDCVVAGPDSFSDQTVAPPIAADSAGNVVAMDLAAGTVKVFTPLENPGQ
jgi:hypothetical protein